MVRVLRSGENIADDRRKDHIDTVTALRDPAVKANFDNIGMVTVGSTPEELAALLTAETEKWQPVIKQAHIALD